MDAPFSRPVAGMLLLICVYLGKVMMLRYKHKWETANKVRHDTFGFSGLVSGDTKKKLGRCEVK